MPVLLMLVRRLVAAAVLRVAARQARRFLGGDPTPRVPLMALVLSCVCIVLTAALGPSAAEQRWPGTPPFHFDAHPAPALVTALLAVAVVAGAYAVLGCLAALRHAWSPDPRRLFAASGLVVLILVLLPPIASADPGSYVGYGRLAATGHDPYVTAPQTLTGSYAGVVEDPWRTTPSIYGPLATGEQWLAAKIGGGGAHGPAHAVLVLGLINGLAFLGSALLLHRLAVTNPGRRRVAVMFTANPLVLFVGVASAHIDVVVALLAVAAIAASCRRGLVGAFGAGLLGGAAAAMKASAALVGAGLALHQRADRRAPVGRLVALTLGAAVVLVPGYLLAGTHAFDQLRHASGFVSFADPWRLVTHPLELLAGRGPARTTIRIAAWIAFVVVAPLLNRGLPGRRTAGVPAMAAARPAADLVLAWLLTAAYVLPWYAVPAWALLALLPPSGYDRALVIWTAVLAVAYLPGRQVALPSWLHDVIAVWKSGVAPVVLLGVTIAAILISLRARA